MSGRLQLAEWLVSANNTLTSRVFVNRIWHHLFGIGIVPTVDYFGVHGERPTHPELLDFLADRFRDENNWSLKLTIEQLVLSRTYQMSSLSTPEAIQLDPDNRYYWRMPRRRLSGESCEILCYSSVVSLIAPAVVVRWDWSLKGIYEGAWRM